MPESLRTVMLWFTSHTASVKSTWSRRSSVMVMPETPTSALPPVWMSGTMVSNLVDGRYSHSRPISSASKVMRSTAKPSGLSPLRFSNGGKSSDAATVSLPSLTNV